MKSKQFGKYLLLEHMGRGGMASVYKAANQETGEIVAIKIFEPAPGMSGEFVQKLMDREMKMLLGIRHPNVVELYETGHVGDQYYYTMEFVENSLLKRMRSGEELTLLDKVRILRQTTNALQAIHHQGIVHRDIKPGNILLDRDANNAIHVKVTDMGIAKNVSDVEVVQPQGSKRIPGTPKYLSPEQIRLMPLDGRSDIFSLGVVAYELLAGKPPFKAKSSKQYLEANLEQEPEPLSQIDSTIPAFMTQLVSKMLAKDREERYDSDTLATDLQLVEQHLVSGTPLAEHNNVNSIFYVPPEGGDESDKGQAPRVRIHRLCWVSVIAIALLGASLTYALWPKVSQPPPARTVAIKPVDEVGGKQALEAASGYVANHSYWRAFALLQGLDRDALEPDEISRFDQLSRTVQEHLAARSYQVAEQMLAQGRMLEAAVLLKRMEAFFPDAAQTRELRDRIAVLKKKAALEEEWTNKMAAVRLLKENGQFPEALKALEALLTQFSDHDAKVSAARKEIVSVLSGWAEKLQKENVGPAEVMKCLDAVQRYRQKGWPEFATGVPTDVLYLKLAELCESRRAYEEALKYYSMIVERFHGPVAERARQATERIEKRLLLQPITIAALNHRLEREGFDSALWRSETAPGARIECVQETIRFVRPASGNEGASVLKTARPVKNLGFRITTQFKVQQPPASGGEWKLGMRVTDRRGNDLTFSFDGQNYTTTKTQKRGSTAISVGSSLCKAIGDEASAWHSMTLHYSFDTRRITLWLDDKKLGQYPLDLGDFGFGIFLWTDGSDECTVAFKGLTFEP